MLHFVVRFSILEISEIDESVGGSLDQVLINRIQSIIEHVSSIYILLVGHQPRLEQILVETVSQSTQRNVL